MRCDNCFNCGNPAVTHNGHVHKGNLVLTAGWCNACIRHEMHKKVEFSSCDQYPAGCLGQWNKMHGFSKN